MLALVAALAAPIALIVTMLAVPVVLFIEADCTDKLKVRWRLFWLFGLIKPRSRNRSAPPAPERADARPPVTPKKRTGGGWRMVVAVLRTRGLFERVVRLARALLRRVTLERLQLDTMVGFENPADTGFVYGCLSPVLVLADVRRLNIRCRPMFLESGVRGAFRATIRVRPLSVVGPMVAFLVSAPVFRAARVAWRTRK
ncbi:MAG TPA: hypothetical protein VGF24_02070 [Vicinamibacterales bacterium]|jgi:hypothetical protein